MRVEDLVHEGLLELDPAGGLIRFAGQRALVLDAVAMGLLRKYLVENFGLTAARAVLTQFGFAHGWRMAEAMERQFAWASTDAWQSAGMRIASLGGLFQVDATASDPRSTSGATLLGSYEAEQHLLHFGPAEEPICWTLCGLASGYLSRSTGAEVYVLEDRCVGAGGAACHLLGRARAEWGEDRAAELRFFEASRLDACLEVSLRRVIDSLKASERKLAQHRRALKKAVPDVDEPLGIIARGPAMRQVVDLARRFAKVDATVLVTGESGSGKERIARLLHDESSRASGPFVAINCGAITETLLESELFGHVRGAFTGAIHDRAGLFEAAGGGTLFLDEVGELSPGMQVKLLRALQEREIRRVGENRVRKVDARVVAATNRVLADDVAAGTFRRDLYYRLKVVELVLPPLRSRPEDILPLARVLLAEAALRMRRTVTSIDPAAANRLVHHPWPGNVRELANAMERAVALARHERVELTDLPAEIQAVSPPLAVASGPVRALAAIEKEYILAALAVNDGNQTRTALQLQIGSATLYRKLKQYRAGDVARPTER